jgi:hypothetical protein
LGTGTKRSTSFIIPAGSVIVSIGKVVTLRDLGLRTDLAAATRQQRMKLDQHTLEACHQASGRAADYLRARLLDPGNSGADVADLAVYYKAPYLFLVSGDLPTAQRLLDHAKAAFMRADGDFVTRPGTKSENAAFQEYWSYPNGWLVIAAQKLGRFDVSLPGARYLASFHSASRDAFVTHDPRTAGASVSDVFTNAHLGLAALYLGDLEKARSAGRMLARSAERQPDPAAAFYLRLDGEGVPIAEFPADASIFYRVSATEPQQAYFMIGYPMAFLGKLYHATGEDACLATARRYLDFAMSCGEAIRCCHYSHKVAWGAAVLAKPSKDETAAELARSIVRHLLDAQNPSGAWLPDEPPLISFDQTAEVAIWLREIAGELA